MNGQAAAFHYDPFDERIMADPFPYYRELRAHHPVYYTPRYDTFWLSRFADLEAMLQIRGNALVPSESSIPMPEVLLTHHKGRPPQASRAPMAPMTLLHSPHYDDIRRAHTRPFTPSAVAAMEADMRAIVRGLLEAGLDKGRFDLFLDYGGMLSALLTCRLFHIDEALAPEILTTVNAATSYDPERGGIDNLQFFLAMKRFMLPAIARRRAEGPDGSDPLYDGLLSYSTREDGRALSDEEVADALTCVFIANTETPGKVAAQGLLELLRRPDQLAQVRGGSRADLRANVVTATEEMLRYCAPAQWFLRTIFEDVTIAGVEMKAGQRVVGLVASANRDEREFENSEAFVWNRPFRKQLAFGMGLHHCIGLHIARMQIRVLVEEFLARVEDYSFDLDAAVLRPSYFHWAYSSLPVTIGSLRT